MDQPAGTASQQPASSRSQHLDEGAGPSQASGHGNDTELDYVAVGEGPRSLHNLNTLEEINTYGYFSATDKFIRSININKRVADLLDEKNHHINIKTSSQAC